MAVVIASNLRKELAGDPLFDGVSFKVERRDRVALSGPNGTGKTTLLRALAGETTLQGGDLAFQKGTRVALHDQRPPLQRGLTLREYVLSGAADLIAVEEELRRLEHAMAGGDHADSTLRRYAEAPRRLGHAGGDARRARLPRHRTPRALRRAVPRFDPEDGEEGAGQVDPDRAAREGARSGEDRDRAADAARQATGLRVPEAAPQRSHGDRGQRRPDHDRRAHVAGRGELCNRARRARRADRPERIREDDAARDPVGSPRGGGGRRAAGTRSRACVLLAAGDRARRTRQRASVRADEDAAPAARRAVSARPLPLLRLGRAREAGCRALRRRAPPPRARRGRRLGRELPRAPRGGEPPRSREPRGPRGRAGGVPRNVAARLTRPRAARCGRGANARDRRAGAHALRRRVGRLRAHPRRAAGSGGRTCYEAPEGARQGCCETCAESAVGARAAGGRDRRARERRRGARTRPGRGLE